MNEKQINQIAKDIKFERQMNTFGISICNINLNKQLDEICNKFGKPNKVNRIFISRLIARYIDTNAITTPSHYSFEDIINKTFINRIPDDFTVNNGVIYGEKVGKAFLEAIPLFVENLREITDFLKQQISDIGYALPNKSYHVDTKNGSGGDVGQYTIFIFWHPVENKKTVKDVSEIQSKVIDSTSNFNLFKQDIKKIGFDYNEVAIKEIVKSLLDVHNMKKDLTVEDVKNNFIIGEYYDEINGLFMEHFSEFIDLINDKDVHSYRVDLTPSYQSTSDTPRNLYIDYSYK